MTLVYQSTRDENNKVTASQAILQGLATDGGLFTPLSTPEVTLDFDQLKDASYQEVAKLVLSAFLGLVRVVGGVHFPKDVVVGYMCALVWGVIFFLC